MVLEVEFRQVVMAVMEAMAAVVAVVREEAERMVVFSLLEQVEQAFHSQFLATMEEIPKHMLQVEMVEKI
jgi:hypothetical protein